MGGALNKAKLEGYAKGWFEKYPFRGGYMYVCNKMSTNKLL